MNLFWVLTTPSHAESRKRPHHTGCILKHSRISQFNARVNGGQLRLIHTRRSGLRQHRDRNFSISLQKRNRLVQTHTENVLTAFYTANYTRLDKRKQSTFKK